MILAADDIPLEEGLRVFYFLCVAGGVFVGWCFEYFRNRLEIQKLRVEIITLTGETLKNLQEARSNYVLACTACSKAATQLVDSLRSNSSVEEVRKHRENLCAAVLEQVIPLYHSYAEWKHLQISGSKIELREFLLDDVVSELRRFLDWISVANRPTLLNGLEQEPVIVAKTTITPFYQLTRGLTGKDLEFVSEQLKRIGSELINQGIINK
jgi:hypothetical protein